MEESYSTDPERVARETDQGHCDGCAVTLPLDVVLSIALPYLVSDVGDACLGIGRMIGRTDGVMTHEVPIIGEKVRDAMVEQDPRLTKEHLPSAPTFEGTNEEREEMAKAWVAECADALHVTALTFQPIEHRPVGFIEAMKHAGNPLVS
jgi:hypothetical protein